MAEELRFFLRTGLYAGGIAAIYWFASYDPVHDTYDWAGTALLSYAYWSGSARTSFFKLLNAGSLQKKLSVFSKIRSNDKTIGERQILLNVFSGHPRTDQYWQFCGTFRFDQIVLIRVEACKLTGHNDAIRQEKLCLPNFLFNIQIDRQGMRAMFFLDIRKHLDLFCTQCFSSS